MPNTYFRFKEFIVHQDKAAMKVCTDACILGAWTAVRIKNKNKILDIGAGTGLLSLMLAQKSAAAIDAIELVGDSADQAKENISKSPWPAQIRLTEGDIRISSLDADYDFIISNPPFYESDLWSPEEKKNKAKHNQSLRLDELIIYINSHLSESGSFSVLLPFHRMKYFETLAKENGFFLQERLDIRQTPAHNHFRSIGLFNRQEATHVISDELTIKNEKGRNSIEFAELMRDYYE